MKRIGRRGAMNIRANQLIRKIVQRRCIRYCENCGATWPLAPAHRHKRVYYRTAQELAEPQQWIILCQKCHDHIETSHERTEELFKRLRGDLVFTS